MKVLNKVLMGTATLVLLTGCAKNVDVTEFQAKVDAMEAHEYSQATVKYDVNLRTSTQGLPDTVTNEKGEVKFTYNADKKEWETTDEAHEGYGIYIRSIQGKKVDVPEVQSGITQEVKYSINSFMKQYKMEITRTGGYESDDLSFRYDKYKEAYTFNKYGYLTKYSYEINATASGVVLGEAFSSSENGFKKITISYK